MFNLNHLLFFLSLILSSVMLTGINLREHQLVADSQLDSLTRTVYAYVDAANVYKNKNPNEAGTVTTKLELPTWLTKNPAISVVSNGVNFYVFTPNKPGLMTKLRKTSFSSAYLGLSNQSTIIKSDGSSTSKPSFIPANQAVFIL